MVERCKCTIEDILKKSMESQTDWCPALPLVLFTIRAAQHASTGFTSFHMLYNYDPILPFEYADKLKHGIFSDGDADCESDVDNALDASDGTGSDPVLSKINEMEINDKQIIKKVSKLIKKSTEASSQMLQQTKQG